MKGQRKITLTAVFEVLLYIFLIQQFYVYTVNLSTLTQNIRTIFLYLTAIVGWILYFVKKHSRRTLLYIIFLIISCIVCYAFTSNGGYYYSFESMRYTISYIGIALGLLSHKNKLFPAAFIYYSFSIVIIVRIVILNENISSIMLNSSYNFISVLMIFYLLIYMIIRHQNGLNMSLVAAIVFFVTALVSYGRSSILTGVILLLLAIYQNYVNATNKQYKYALVCFTAILLVFTLMLLLGSSGILNSLLGNFYTRGMSSISRERIWTTYIQECTHNWRYFIFGGNVYNIRLDGNLHNFILQMHAAFGIIFTLINLGIIICFVIKGVKARDIFMVFLLISLLFRALFDRVLFLGYNEVFYFYFIFYYFEKYSDIKLLGKTKGVVGT